MRNIVILTFMVFCISTVSASFTAASASAADSSFTQSDRDRMIRLEEGLKATNQRIDDGLKATNQRIDDMGKKIDDMGKKIDDMGKKIDDVKADVNKRLDQMYTLILWGFGILFGLFFSGMVFLVGFVLWDRRTALAPAVRKTNEVEERTELLEKALKEAAVENPGLKKALKHFGLL
ncbi:MAG: hypothetical protein HQK89_01855 [Nitrospirae bacterium]|nr:hypothetical protein [Nitrospirota bacterium]